MRPNIYRVAGIAGLGFIALGFLGLGGPYYDSPSRGEVLDWARSNADAIMLDGSLFGFTPILFAVAVLAVIHRSNDRGLLSLFAVLAATADVVVGQVTMMVNFALAEVASSTAGQGADDAVIALFSLSKMTDWMEALTAGFAILLTSALCLRTRTLPRAICWLGIVDGVIILVGGHAQVLITGEPGGGPSGLIGAMLGLVWVLSVSVTLLLDRSPSREQGQVPSSASGR